MIKNHYFNRRFLSVFSVFIFFISGAEAQVTLTANPDISAILDGTISYEVSENTTTLERDRLTSAQFREVEIGIQAVVDPFGRADIFLGFHADEVEVEEAYATLLTLPWGVQGRLGLFRPALGKLNLTHFSEIPMTQTPLVYSSLLEAEEGLVGAGAEASVVIDALPWYSQIKAAAVELRGHADESETGVSEEARVTSYLAHWKNFFEINNSANVELGILGGKKVVDGRDLIGGDLTIRWRPERMGLYRSFWWQSESFILPKTDDEESRWGGFSFVQWQMGRQWYAGLGLEATQEVESSSSDLDQAVSARVTFFPSEFSRYRLEARRRQHPESGEEWQGWFQYTYAIGPHRPHGF